MVWVPYSASVTTFTAFCTVEHLSPWSGSPRVTVKPLLNPVLLDSRAVGFQCCRIPFARILFRILAIISLKDTDLYYSFVVVVWIAK